MKVNVEGIAPNLKGKVVEIVESISPVKFTHLPNEGNMMQLVFEVEDGDVDMYIGLIKRAIMTSELGTMTVFRVVPNGALYYEKGR